MEDLPDEVVVEILLRLPPSPAHHSKLVCKRWYSLLSSPLFAQCFAARKPKMFSILVPCFGFGTHGVDDGPLFSSGHHQLKSFKGFSLNFLRHYSHNQIRPLLLASCNDLLLCRIQPCKDRNVYVVCNPITERWVQLPPPPPPSPSFDAAPPPCRLNGLLSYSSSRYAVVSVLCRLSAADSYSELNLRVFYSDSFKWSQITKRYDVRPSFRQGSAISYNGLLFWLYKGQGNNGTGGGLMAVDPDNLWKSPSFFDTPKGFSFHLHETLGECAGCLRLFQISEQHPTCINVWDILKLYDKNIDSVEWVCCRKVAFQDMTSSVYHPNFPPKVIGCHPDDPDIVYVLIGDLVGSYNLLEQHLEMVSRVSGSFLPYHACRFTFSWQPTQVIA